MSREHQEELRH